MTWEVQRRSGLRVRSSSPRAAVGVTMASGLGIGPLRLWAPWEAFTVVHEPDDSVVLRIVAFSKPANRFVAVGGPVSRRVQRFVTRRYLRALA